MKKICAILSAAVLMIGAGAANVTAGAYGRGSHHANCSFVDEDNDGICDNCAGGVCGGIGRGSHHANCSFIDEDGNGICDNCAGGVCPQNAAGRGHHNKKGGRHRNR